MVQSLQIRRTSGALGAEISGVDLGQELPDATIAAIRQALVEHQVIFFRDQDLTPARQVAFGARFGPLNIHPYVQGMAGQPEVMEIGPTLRPPMESVVPNAMPSSNTGNAQITSITDDSTESIQPR